MYLQFYITGNYDKQRYFEEGWVCTDRAGLNAQISKILGNFSYSNYRKVSKISNNFASLL